MLIQFRNALLPMEVTLRGIFNVPIDVQFSNAEPVINNKLPPSAIDGMFEHLANVNPPIV